MPLVNRSRPRPAVAAPPPAPPRPATVAAAAPAASSTPSKPGAPPIVAWEDVKASCGHTEKFGLFADKVDRFRDARRRKVTDRPCKACREKRQQEEQAVAEVRKAAGQSKRQIALPLHGRLPDGAQFQASYDAATTTWRGTLSIEGRVFEASASGIMNLLRVLDRQYRQAMPEKAAAAAGETTPMQGAVDGGTT